MRHRTTILILLACMFAVIPAMESNRQAATCAERYGEASGDLWSFNFSSDGSCATTGSSGTPLERLLLVLAVGCAGAAVFSAAKAWRDRQRDSALLRSAAFSLTRHHYRP